MKAVVVLAAVLALIPAAPAAAETGAYLDIGAWPSIDQSTTLGPEGVPQVRYGGRLEDNAVTVEQWALQHWTWWTRTATPADLDAAMRGADWLLEHQQPDGTWHYEFDWSDGGAVMKAPWTSALAQGQALSVLVRAFDHTGDQRYLDAADLALLPFGIATDQGGVRSDWDGTDWYEEYPTPALHVLNGFEFTLVGLHDLGTYGSGDATAEQLYDDGLEGLIAHIGAFDVPSARSEVYGALGGARALVHGTWPSSYPGLHASLTRYLAGLSGSQTLADYAARWEGYLQPPPITPTATPTPTTPAVPPPAPPWSCRIAGAGITRHGHVSCHRARHVLGRALAGKPIRSSAWRCHYHRRSTACWRRSLDGVTVRKRSRRLQSSG